MNIDEFFASALKNFHGGKLNEAERQLVFLSNESLSERGIASVSQLLGMVYASAGKYVEAAKAFEFASTKNPRDASIFSSLCSCLFAVGKADEAIVAGEKAVILAPNEGDAHYNLANALKQKGDLEKAAEHYRETVEISPELMPAYNSLGVIYLQLGDLKVQFQTFGEHWRSIRTTLLRKITWVRHCGLQASQKKQFRVFSRPWNLVQIQHCFIAIMANRIRTLMISKTLSRAI
jgi:tetratricopeptide (TPR) repeat protein